jgi:hypothetical protein
MSSKKSNSTKEKQEAAKLLKNCKALLEQKGKLDEYNQSLLFNIAQALLTENVKNSKLNQDLKADIKDTKKQFKKLIKKIKPPHSP